MRKKNEKIALIFLGTILILGLVAGGNYTQLLNWSTPEQIGYNSFAIFMSVAAFKALYHGVRK